MEAVLDRLGGSLIPPSKMEGEPPGAVLASLRKGPDLPLVLTRRAHHLSLHAGQLSFPGGRREPHESALSCALREANEEIGLDPADVRLLGCLPDRPSPRGPLIRCFVAAIPGNAKLAAEPAEVEAIVETPLARLVEPGVYEGRALDPSSGAPFAGRTIHVFHVDPVPLWGFTAARVVELLERALGWAPPPPRTFDAWETLRAGLP